MVTATSASGTDNINNLKTNTGSATDNAAAKAQTNYQDFLKLLTTQLQNQDPTAPADTNQLTQQIATLSQVEQQINTNKNLEKLITLLDKGSINNYVSFIGKQVEAAGNKIALLGSSATIAYDLEEEPATLELIVSDKSGAEVFRGAGTKKIGRNEILWNGTDKYGNQLADGQYSFQVVAKNTSNELVKSTTYTVGTVTSVELASGQATLAMGDIKLAAEKVLSVREAIALPPTTGEETAGNNTTTNTGA
jgi:flagellar basal-body rod modification protein FlgD